MILKLFWLYFNLIKKYISAPRNAIYCMNFLKLITCLFLTIGNTLDSKMVCEIQKAKCTKEKLDQRDNIDLRS